MTTREHQRLRILDLIITCNAIGWTRSALRELAHLQMMLLAPAPTAGCQ